MEATLKYELPKEQEAFNAALRGPEYRCLLFGLIPKLTKLAYPDDAPEHKGLQVVLQQLEHYMDEMGMNREIQLGESEGE